MTHHVMNQMGHNIPNMVGMKPGDLDDKISSLLPGYMTMGQDGMHDMGQMGMQSPANSLPMVGAEGPFGYITMGGMFTLLKVRDEIQDYRDPGWYDYPEGSVATVADQEQMKQDGIHLG